MELAAVGSIRQPCLIKAKQRSNETGERAAMFVGEYFSYGIRDELKMTPDDHKCILIGIRSSCRVIMAKSSRDLS